MADLFNLDLGPMGAPGFELRDRLDMSGHQNGRVAPHINTDLINPDGNVIRNTGQADFRDLAHNQLPGFNGMQFEK
jgi:hypothetical protein